MSSCVDIASLLLCFWSRQSRGFIGSLQTLKHHSPSELSSSLVPRCALDKGNIYPSAKLFLLKRGFATACVGRTLTRQLATTETQFCQTSTSFRDENKRLGTALDWFGVKGGWWRLPHWQHLVIWPTDTGWALCTARHALRNDLFPLKPCFWSSHSSCILFMSSVDTPRCAI